MNKNEALKMAIEVLEHGSNLELVKVADIRKALNACKEALEQPAPPLTRDWIGTALERADRNEAFRKGLIGEFAQPLSDDEIVQIAMGKGYANRYELCIDFARAIEQAHGIKDEV